MIALEKRMVPEYGVTLPWKRFATGYDAGDGIVPGETVFEEGEVWVPLQLIAELSEQGDWDSQFGSAFIALSQRQGWALTQGGWAVRETRGGHHRTDKTAELLEELHAQYERVSKT